MHPHERDPDNPVNADVMDRHNNDIGDRFARDHPPSLRTRNPPDRKTFEAGNTDDAPATIEHTPG